MFKSFFNRADDAASRKGIGYAVTVTLAVSAIVALSFLAGTVADGIADLTHRIIGLVIAALSMLVLAHALRLRLLLSLRSATMLTVAVVVQLLVQVGVLELCGRLPGYNLPAQCLLFFPYMLAPTVVAVMVGRRPGSYAALFCSLLGLGLFPASFPQHLLVDYTLISLTTGVIVAQFAGRVHRREQVLQAGILAAVLVLVCSMALIALHNVPADLPHELATFRKGFHFGGFAAEVGVTLGFNFVLAALIGGLMPALERLFNISTPITWLEWADMNHPLLKKLQITAPGTFHHSLVVQRLAEAAAEAVCADVTRAGVCGLYHDIGKIRNPQFFAENIIDYTNSLHNELTPEASARIITAHVQDGVEMAEAHGLNRRIVSVIREHHGVSTAYFFYRKAMDLYEEAKDKFEQGLVDTCPDEPDKSIFTYKGPIPQTRESGIVSMADAVESATRSLQHPTEADIRAMIDGIFKGRVLDGHLQDSGLTLGDIAKMKESFFQTIRTMHHNRISYPKPKDDDATTKLVEQHMEDKNKA